MEFSKKYNPKDFETEIYSKWENSGMFEPKASKTGKTFYMPMPPPNVTGTLHIGHALALSLEDIMVRYHRMKGDETLWVPGTDHAGISTQTVVEKKLHKEGKKRIGMAREEFVNEVWDWVGEYGDTIKKQIRLIGASCDWSKERFTLDEGLSKTVEYAFCDLYKKGLIYRGEYMVNYSPALDTVISDIEVEYKEEQAKMYYITYFVSGSDNELTIATTRPETLLADQAVAVHPKDKRYKKLIGRKVILPILNKEIPIIGDDSVEKDFGTGVLKITPSHDPADFAIAKKHNLRLDYNVIDRKGIMTKEAGIFAGQDFLTARENVVELLRAKGNLIKIEPYVHKVGYCERTGCKIETVISTQWFVKTEDIAKKVLDGYKKKEFKIVPERFNKVFEDWIYNIKDWCISRQLWWGHRIPAYYDKNTGELLIVSSDENAVYEKFGKDNVVRDEDVLDTWFSSALWPFSILDWDNKTPSDLFKHFYPANVLETGHDIIFFWVIRMLLFGYEFTGKSPFETIYLNGLVKDEQGRKMSKSLGNGIDPIKVIDEYSADSLRLSLVLGNTPGNNMNFSMRSVEGYSIFLNKLWNIARFVSVNIGEIPDSYEDLLKNMIDNYEDFSMHEKWIISRLVQITEKVTEGMEKYSFSMTGEELVSFIKDEFADFYIEEYKLTKDESKHANDILSFVLLSILKLAHPYIPFVTEELYSKFRQNEDIINSNWPKIQIKRDLKTEKDISTVYDLIKAIRVIRAEKGVKPGDMISCIFKTGKTQASLLNENELLIKGLGKVSDLKMIDKNKELDESQYTYQVIGNIEIYADLGGCIDPEEERQRLKSLIDEKRNYIRKLDQKLLNGEFIRNAPEHIVRIEQDKKMQAEEQLEKLISKLSLL